MTSAADGRAHEWATLQNNIEGYERLALLIKLLATLGAVQCVLFGMPWLAIAAVLVLWLQEGIFRTSQARLGERILRLESAGEVAPHQLHSEWQASRPGTVGLVVEYIRNALRPTVAFPYPLLLVLVGAAAWLGDAA